jgi:uncharacterized membrane protein YebE (DUF533 family)
MAGNSILEQMLEAATQGGGLKGGGRGGQGGGLGDLLGSVLGGGQGNGSAKGGGLEDILGGMLGAGPQSGRGAAPGGGLGDILGQVLGGAQQGGGRVPSGGGGPGGGGLGDILGQVLGGAGAGTAAGRSSGGRFNPGPTGLEGARLDPGSQPAAPMPSYPEPSSRFPSSGGEPAAPSQPGSSGLNDLVKYGGLAVIGMVAYKALREWQAGKTPDAPPPSGGGFLPNQMPVDGDDFSRTLVQAMIAATQADGIVDEDEQRRLVGQLEKNGASDEDRREVAASLRKRVDPQSLVDAAKTKEMALAIYTASALAITADSPAERRYLDGLAQRLGIDPGLKAHLEQTVGRR